MHFLTRVCCRRSSFLSIMSTSFKSCKGVKPPNILVLVPNTDPTDVFQRAKETLQTCLGYERYAIYPLQSFDVSTKKQPWQENCMLFVVPNSQEALLPEVVCEIGEFVLKGGRCLSMNKQISSHVLNSISKRPCINTTAVGADDNDGGLEDELMLVRPLDPNLKPFYSLKCIYDSLMQFEDSSIDVNWSVMNLAKASSLQSIGTPTTDDNGLPCVWLVSDPPAQRVSIVSFLELMAPDASKMAALEKIKETGELRHRFLKAIFDLLGLECGSADLPSLSHVYLATRSNSDRESLLGTLLKGSDSYTIKGSEVSAVICTDDFTAGTPVDPVDDSTHSTTVVIAKPSSKQLNSLDFSSERYFDHLKTSHIGRCLLVGPVVTSTQTFFTGNIPLVSRLSVDSGVIFVAGQQTKGRGRGGNVWISPKGCLMFSLPLVLPPSSKLIRRLSILQHIMALSVVSAIRSMDGYQHLPITIKWPNDVYYQKEAKLGGIIVTTFSMGQETIAVIGCGVNVDNHFPTVSLNDCIRLYNKSVTGNEQRLPTLTLEDTLAAVVNKLELYLSLFEEWGFKAIEELYYQYWMHSNAEVTVSNPSVSDNPSLSATITGIDEFGYLRVRSKEDGQFLTLQPDGNSFDIMKGLIRMKT